MQQSLHALLPLALLALGPRSVEPAPLGPDESVLIELVRTSEMRFEVDLAGQTIEGFELASESRRAKRVRRARDEGEPAWIVSWEEAQERFSGPDGEHEQALDIEGLSARVGRSRAGFRATTEEGGRLARELEELVLREELAPDGETLALDWLVASLAAVEAEERASSPLAPELVLWLVGDDEGLFAEAEATLESRGLQEREGEEVLVLALAGEAGGESEDDVELSLELGGELWLEPDTRRPLRIALEGPLEARGERDASDAVAFDGEGRFTLRIAFSWQR